jgi:hypothetical protein
VSIEDCRLDTVSSMEVIEDTSNDHQSGCLCEVFVNCVESSTNLFTIEVSVLGDCEWRHGQWNFDKMKLNQIIRWLPQLMFYFC